MTLQTLIEDYVKTNNASGLFNLVDGLRRDRDRLAETNLAYLNHIKILQTKAPTSESSLAPETPLCSSSRLPPKVISKPPNVVKRNPSQTKLPKPTRTGTDFANLF